MNYKGLLSMLLVVMIVLVGCGQKDGKVEIEEKESIKKKHCTSKNSTHT